MNAQVVYQDKKGAGCMRSFVTEADLERFISMLRRPARILRDGQQIGEVWDGDCDDKRVRWLWAFERWESK